MKIRTQKKIASAKEALINIRKAQGNGYTFLEASHDNFQKNKLLIMKTYRGFTKINEVKIIRVSDSNDTNYNYFLNPADSQKIINHSPDGFSWGYNGSGPLQTSLAILVDYYSSGNPEDQPESQWTYPRRFYQKFCNEVVSKFNLEWNYTSSKIQDWLDDQIGKSIISNYQARIKQRDDLFQWLKSC